MTFFYPLDGVQMVYKNFARKEAASKAGENGHRRRGSQRLAALQRKRKNREKYST